MSSSAMPTTAHSPAAAEAGPGRSLAVVVLASIAAGLALGLLLVLVVLVGAQEAEITGAGLMALGSGFTVLGLASSRSSRPQRWALVPGAASGLSGLLLIAFTPAESALEVTGWLWPVLLVLMVVWSVRGARRTLDHWSRRALLYPSFVVLLLVAVGGAFQTVAAATTATTANPAPGRSYPVAGHSLYLHCVGGGEPTVVLFNGLGERTPSWARVQQGVSASTRVCAFDRAGEGWSGASPGRQDGERLAADLHGLLRAAHVPGPYVLAGHSVGGVYALVYANQYPREVAGVALIDSATPHQFELPDYPGFYSMGRRLYALMPSFARVGIGRLAASAQFGALPPQARRRARVFASSPRELRADQADFEELPTVFEQAKALKSLDGRPLAVVTAGAGAQDGWQAAQDRLAGLSRNSVQQTIVGATHSALLEDKRFAWFTTRAITQVVAVARSGRR